MSIVDTIALGQQAIENAKSGNVSESVKYFVAAHVSHNQTTIPVGKVYQFLRKYGNEPSESDLTTILEDIEGVQLTD